MKECGIHQTEIPTDQIAQTHKALGTEITKTKALICRKFEKRREKIETINRGISIPVRILINPLNIKIFCYGWASMC